VCASICAIENCYQSGQYRQIYLQNCDDVTCNIKVETATDVHSDVE